MAKPTTRQTSKYPLKLRLKAWWQGFDPDDLAKREGWTPEPEPASEPRAARPRREPDAAPLTEAEELLPVEPWDQSRIDIAQYIWGAGYCGPGGPEHIIQISKLLALTPQLSMADLGAGLGGPERTLVEHFGVWMTGYEGSQVLVKAGNELSTMAGMAKKAPLVHFDPEDETPFERNYDRFLLKDMLHTVENKIGLLKRVEAGLKADGLVLVIDYVIGKESDVAAPEYREWKEAEPHTPHMITQEELNDLMVEAGLSVRVNEDQSKVYVGIVTHAWQGVDKVVERLMQNPEERHLIGTLLKEAELWNRRVQLLNSGRLKIVRMLGAKRAKKPGGLSNW